MPDSLISTELLQGTRPVRSEREKLHTPSTINIFAIEDRITETHHVTEQGFGYPPPLAKPEISENTYYRWQGLLHPNTAQRATNPEGVQSSNSRDSLEELAENFAQNYRDRQDTVLQQRGEASYFLHFQPTKEQLDELMKTNSDVSRVVRGLNSEEQRRFMDAFLGANKTAARKK